MKWSRIIVAGIGTSVAVFLVITLAATGYAFKLAFEVRGAPDQARIGQFAAHLGRSYWWVLQILLTVPAAVWAVQKGPAIPSTPRSPRRARGGSGGTRHRLHSQRSDAGGVRADRGRRLARRRYGCASSNEAGSRQPDNALNLANAGQPPQHQGEP